MRTHSEARVNQTLIRVAPPGSQRANADGGERRPASPGPYLLEVMGKGFTPRTILVIEDKPDVADTMRMGLTLSGHVVYVALDGEEGIRMALRKRPEVILSDIGLPGAVDGFSVAETLRASGFFESTYMIAVTGSSEADYVKRALSAGFDLHMAKPVDMRTLLRLIAERFSENDL